MAGSFRTTSPPVRWGQSRRASWPRGPLARAPPRPKPPALPGERAGGGSPAAPRPRQGRPSRPSPGRPPLCAPRRGGPTLYSCYGYRGAAGRVSESGARERGDRGRGRERTKGREVRRGARRGEVPGSAHGLERGGGGEGEERRLRGRGAQGDGGGCGPLRVPVPRPLTRQPRRPAPSLVARRRRQHPAAGTNAGGRGGPGAAALCQFCALETQKT